MTRPLEGLKVLDLARVLAGPYVGRVLADLGADVVKVEPPEGDLTRRFGRKVAGLSSYFTQQNAGKRNVSVDLAAPGGPELIADLAAQADILLENFRPGIMARFGLDYAALSARNQRLIMVSISGFGQDGPESGRAAYAPVVHAESGAIARNAQFSGAPQADLSQGYADTTASMHGLIGLLTALYHRERTGEGQHIDIAMLDAYVFNDDYNHWTLDGQVPENGGGRIWQTGAGPIMIAGGDLKLIWLKLSTVFGYADPSPRDAPLEEKVAGRQRLAEVFFAGLGSREELIAALDRANLAWGDVKTGAAVFDSPTLQHRGTVAEVDDRDGGVRRITRPPQRFSTLEHRPAGPASFRGEHNTEVLAEWLDRDAEAVPPGVLQAE